MFSSYIGTIAAGIFLIVAFVFTISVIYNMFH